jgi:hypothetical protein
MSELIKVGDFVDIVSGELSEKWFHWTFQVLSIDESSRTAEVAAVVFGGPFPFMVPLHDLKFHPGLPHHYE